MKRILISAVGTCALALAIPGAALAHAGHEVAHHHHRHHHKTHHRTFRVLQIRVGSASTSPPAGAPGATAPSSTAPGGGSAPTIPGTGATAATVVSFSGGVLTLRLAGGATISGTVTSATVIECEPARATPLAGAAEDHGDRGPGGGEDNRGPGNGGQDQSGPGRHDQGQDDDNGNDRDHGDAARCDTTALLAGAVVHEAELRIGPAGSRFTSIELSR
jgi:hypothetical protein